MDNQSPGPSNVSTEPNLSSDDNYNDFDSSDDECVSEESDFEDPDYDTNPLTWQPNTIGMRDLPFTKQEGFLVPIPGNRQPIDFFHLLVDQIFLERICVATNKYALELFCGPNTTPESRITRWKDTTVEELYIFLGLILHMGIIVLPQINDYWKKDKLFGTCFPKFMSRDRFLLLLRCINFEPYPNPNNRLTKVQFMIDYFNNKMDAVYYPQKNLCIDEAMVLWRGRLQFRQYIKGKRHKFGIKLYTLCDPHGLILRFFIYCGVLEDMGGKGHAANVVLKLMQRKLNCGHALFMDNYYNSVSLAAALLRRNTYCTGTLRLDRKYNPVDVKVTNIKTGETVGRYSEGILVGKWKDKRVVSYISTEFENEMVTSLNRNNVDRIKPKPIVMYNYFMKGVDRSDQMMSYYPCERKTLRWYKKIFVHLMQMLVSNAHYLYNEATIDNKRRKMPLYDFRKAVINSLLPDQPNLGRQLAPRQQNHVPTKVQGKRKGSDKTSRQKRCRVCSRAGITKRVTWHCEACDDQPGLCVPGCFDRYHK